MKTASDSPQLARALAKLPKATEEHSAEEPLKTAEEKVILIQACYQACVGTLESFEGDEMVGPDLAYLVGSICNGTWCEWSPERRIVEVLQGIWPDASSPIWWYIRIDQEACP